MDEVVPKAVHGVLMWAIGAGKYAKQDAPPLAYIVKNLGLADSAATTYEQMEYAIQDVVPKSVQGVLMWAISAGKDASTDTQSRASASQTPLLPHASRVLDR